MLSKTNYMCKKYTFGGYMIYIRKNGETLEKYEVVFSKKEIEELMVRIAKDCGERHYEEKEDELSFIPNNGSWVFSYLFGDTEPTLAYIDNVHYKKNGKIITHYHNEWPDFDAEIYDCSYSIYFAPFFVEFIRNFINNQDSAVETMFKKEFSFIEYFPTVEEKIKVLKDKLMKHQRELIEKRKNKIEELNKLCDNIDDNSNNIIEGIESLHIEDNKAMKSIEWELAQYMEIRDLNRNQKPIGPYVEELLSLIQFRLADTIQLSEIERINSFFKNGTKNMQTSKVLERVLKSNVK